MSSPPLRVFLSPEEYFTLFQLRKSQDIPKRTKERAEMVRLNACSWRLQKLLAIFIVRNPPCVRHGTATKWFAQIVRCSSPWVNRLAGRKPRLHSKRFGGKQTL
jgi:hypothetical protein